MESQPFAGSKPGGPLAGKDSGVPPDVGLQGESRPIEATGRLDFRSNAVLRDGSRPSGVDIVPVPLAASTANFLPPLSAARSQLRTSGSAGSSASGGGRLGGRSPRRVATPVTDTDCQSPQLQFLSRDNSSGAAEIADKLVGLSTQRMSNVVLEDSSSAQSRGGGSGSSSTMPRRGAHAAASTDMA